MTTPDPINMPGAEIFQEEELSARAAIDLIGRDVRIVREIRLHRVACQHCGGDGLSKRRRTSEDRSTLYDSYDWCLNCTGAGILSIETTKVYLITPHAGVLVSEESDAKPIYERPVVQPVTRRSSTRVTLGEYPE